MRNYAIFLKDIYKAMSAIETFVAGMTLEQFRQDDKTSSAVIRKFEIIGEAAKNIPIPIKKQYSQIPWKEMAGMRDKLIHFYFGIKHELVWRTITDVIPVVKPLIGKIIEDSAQPR